VISFPENVIINRQLDSTRVYFKLLRIPYYNLQILTGLFHIIFIREVVKRSAVGIKISVTALGPKRKKAEAKADNSTKGAL